MNVSNFKRLNILYSYILLKLYIELQETCRKIKGNLILNEKIN